MRTTKLLRYMDMAMDHAVPTEESTVVDFAVHLLKLLGYVTRAEIPLVICGQDRHAKTDVCIVDSENDNDNLLLVQEDKEPKDPEPQLIIAEAIAVFQTYDHRRTRILGQDPIAHSAGNYVEWHFVHVLQYSSQHRTRRKC